MDEGVNPLMPSPGSEFISPITGGVEHITFGGEPSTSSTINTAPEAEAQALESRDVFVPYLPVPLITLPEFQKLFNQLNINFDQPLTDQQMREIQLRLSEIAIGILDKWNESIKEVEKEKEQERKSPIRLALEYYLDLLADGRMGSRVTSSPELAIAILLIGPGLTTAVRTEGVAGVTNAFSTFDVVNNSVSQILGLVPKAYQGVLATAINFFATKAIYQSNIVAVLQKGGKEAFNANFVKVYAAFVSKIVTNPTYDDMISAMIAAKAKEVGKLSEVQRQALIAMSKLVLLFGALAAIYKIETGAITSDEVAGMLTGEIKLPENDPRIPLILLTRQFLMQLGKEQRVKFIEGMLEFFDSKPSVEDILSSGKIFLRGFASKEFERISKSKA